MGAHESKFQVSGLKFQVRHYFMFMFFIGFIGSPGGIIPP